MRAPHATTVIAGSGPIEPAAGEPASPVTVTGRTPAPTTGQLAALAELRAIAAGGDALRVYPPRGPDGHGRIEVEVSLYCAQMPRAATGAVLRARERVTVVIGPQAPLHPPAVRVEHTRFRDLTHVVWGEVCLYRSPAIEWDHADGMFGFITRLAAWFAAAALDALDPDGQPLHPPLAAADPRAGLLVVHADAPEVTDLPWRGVALLHRVHPQRHDLLGWRRLGDPWPRTAAQARTAIELPPDGDAVVVLAPAVIAPHAIGRGVYPGNARVLLAALEDTGANTFELLTLIYRVLQHNRTVTASPTNVDGMGDGELPFMIVGDPTRGVAGADGWRQANVVAWSMPVVLERMAVASRAVVAGDDATATGATAAINQAGYDLNAVATRWVPVDDARAETTVRRDADTAAAWLTDRRVLVLGVGALGAPIAEMCVRGGAARVTIADSATVRRGTLVRQPYTDDDLGIAKVTALARRLRAVTPQVEVVTHFGDAAALLHGPDADFEHDLIIDATAHRGVRASLEHARRLRRDQWPPHVTVLVGPTAARGVATLSRAIATGGGTDILRRLGRAAHDTPPITSVTSGSLPEFATPDHGFEGAAVVASDFFPPTLPPLFAPEPGCSDATFVGSAADTAALVGQLFAGVLAALAAPRGSAGSAMPMSALVVHTPPGPADPPPPGPRWLSWPDDDVLDEDHLGYEVRISATAQAAIDTEVRAAVTRRADDVETGGTLFGAIDDALGVIWVDEATGPPPDSTMTSKSFHHGTDGLAELIAEQERRSSHATSLLGLWHTHPFSSPEPSKTDRDAMNLLVGHSEHGPRRALLLVLGGLDWAQYLAGVTGHPRRRALLIARPEPSSNPDPDQGFDQEQRR